METLNVLKRHRWAIGEAAGTGLMLRRNLYFYSNFLESHRAIVVFSVVPEPITELFDDFLTDSF